MKTKEKCSVINKLLMGKNEILFNLFYLIADDKNALFISRNKRRISNKTVQHIVYSYLDKVGLGGQGLSVHKLRHTAATLMYQSGKVDIRVLKDILGHEQLNTTQIYTHVDNSELRIAARANPLAKYKPNDKKVEVNAL